MLDYYAISTGKAKAVLQQTYFFRQSKDEAERKIKMLINPGPEIIAIAASTYNGRIFDGPNISYTERSQFMQEDSWEKNSKEFGITSMADETKPRE